MSTEFAKRSRATEAVLERARVALPEPSSQVRDEFEVAISEYQEYLKHNELGLAFEALRDAAVLVASRGGVWKDLIRAAELMEMNVHIPELQRHFEAATARSGGAKEGGGDG